MRARCQSSVAGPRARYHAQARTVCAQQRIGPTRMSCRQVPPVRLPYRLIACFLRHRNYLVRPLSILCSLCATCRGKRSRARVCQRTRVCFHCKRSWRSRTTIWAVSVWSGHASGRFSVSILTRCAAIPTQQSMPLVWTHSGSWRVSSSRKRSSSTLRSKKTF